MKPLIKWAGGKRHIASELISRFPSDWSQGTYFEPFIGGGAIFLQAAPKKAVIADLNSRLYGFYKHVKRNPEELHEAIKTISEEFNASKSSEKKNTYLMLRRKFNETLEESLDSAALLYSLNKLCFNGLYRENAKGEFNVPFGNKKELQNLDEKELLKVSSALKETKIINADFESTMSLAKNGDFIYLDPPYIPKNATSSFTSYHSIGFGIEEQKRLANCMLAMKRKGVRAMCSNSDTTLTRDVFSQLNMSEIKAPRMVSAKATGRGTVTELVITNYEEK